ncbi:hypothetical protein Tco_0189062, partial [Tanacetum coccineum]
MMLPNALFDASDLFVAAINGVWSWWSVGDVGDLTWVICFVLGIFMVVAPLWSIERKCVYFLEKHRNAYAHSLPPLLYFVIDGRAGDSDGHHPLLVVTISKNEKGVRMEADTFLWLSIMDLLSAIDGVLRGNVGDLTWVSDPLILLLRLLLFLLKITIYGSGLLILSAYAPSLPPLFLLPLLMACDDSDGLSVPKRVRSKFGLCASWRGKLAEFAAMAAISKNEEGVRMEADTFLWLLIVDLPSAVDGVLR